MNPHDQTWLQVNKIEEPSMTVIDWISLAVMSLWVLVIVVEHYGS